ncbi:MAG TPA: hypothetical protein VHE34_08770 [Puia sp.]|uniref:hypothetical protein n=1 Tax=Puia sp. TaxID=2045100 RepID=UPI002BBBEDAF|nr:hypothetical protein [Puia sp.]HVU95303.1 hypothetical protein [Puia sp.]
MRYVEAFNHHNGEAEWRKRELFDWITDVFEAPGVMVEKRSTTEIRSHIRAQLDDQGWSGEIQIDQSCDLTVFSRKDDLAFQVQTGNISRAFYDLVKLNYLYSTGKIEAAALAVPSYIAAQRIGSNIASFTRIMNELSLFSRVISIPLLLISFE